MAFEIRSPYLAVPPEGVTATDVFAGRGAGVAINPESTPFKERPPYIVLPPEGLVAEQLSAGGSTTVTIGEVLPPKVPVIIWEIRPPYLAVPPSGGTYSDVFAMTHAGVGISAESVPFAERIPYLLLPPEGLLATEIATGEGTSVVIGDIYRTEEIEEDLAPDFGVDDPIAGVETIFTDLSGGNPISWEWDFGDGYTSTDQHPKHTYACPGSYSIKLNISNESGSKEGVREIAVRKPQASFTVPSTRVDFPGTYNFTDNSESKPTSWLWQFGDGESSEEQNPQHTYNCVGEYYVTLISDYGPDIGKTSFTKVVNVNKPYVAWSSDRAGMWETTTIYVPGEVKFTLLSDSEPKAVTWEFGDGEVSTERDPTHTFKIPGKYNVTVTADFGYGVVVSCTSDPEYYHYWIRVDSPIGALSITPYRDPVGSGPSSISRMGFAEVGLYVSGIDGYSGYSNPVWDLGDGTRSTELTPSHLYLPGEYTISVEVDGGAKGKYKATYPNAVVVKPARVFSCCPEEGGGYEAFGEDIFEIASGWEQPHVILTSDGQLKNVSSYLSEAEQQQRYISVDIARTVSETYEDPCGESALIAVRSDGKLCVWDYPEPPVSIYNAVKVRFAGSRGEMAIALLEDGQVIIWGYKPLSVPEGLRVVDICGSKSDPFALFTLPDNSVVGIRDDSLYEYYADNPPADVRVVPGTVTTARVGALAIGLDGKIVAWGREHYSGSYIRVPDVVVTAVALYGGDWAGGLAILEDGGLIEFDLRSTSYRRVAPDYFAHKVFTTTQSDPYVYADLKKTFSFKGAVYDAWAKVNQGRDVPVPYAKVSVGEYLVECDENGEFAIESPTSALAIQDGTPLLVNVRADGYTNRSKIVEAKKIGMKVKIRLWPSNTY